jgi:hypothetical protein
MTNYNSYLAPAAVLLAGLLLGACGNSGSADVKTTTPSSMLGTDSAATKVGGMPPDTVGAGTAAPGVSQ